MHQRLALVGRSSSHFTRVARIFATELGVEHEFRPVYDLLSEDAADYAGNPALKIPVLVDEEGSLFGCDNVCRALARRTKRGDVVLRGDVPARVVANAEELTLHAMSAGVTLIMAKMADDPRLAPAKVSLGLENCLTRLDGDVDAMLAALPSRRALSFVEVALFCLVTHLRFREIVDPSRWMRLGAFVERFGERTAARETAYRFDVKPT